MSVIRVGSSSTYATGWDAIFGGGRGRPGTKKPQGKTPSARKPASRKKAVKKAAAAHAGSKSKRPLKAARKRS
jgi:hypothetical protein